MAATSVLNRVGAPQRVVTIIEGESLINDGVALTASAFAVEAIGHPFTVGHGLLRLVEVVLGGVAYGLAVAVVVGCVQRYIRDPSIQILLTLLTPYIAYIPADQFHVSGVLAAATTGIYLGTRTEGLLQPRSRASGTVFWRTLIFLLESALFVLLGLELRSVVGHLSVRHSIAWLAGRDRRRGGRSDPDQARLGAARIAAAHVPARQALRVRAKPSRQRLVIGWGGLRAAISLAIALTLPRTLNGRPFGERATLIFLTAVVVLVTLIGEGLTLAPLLRVLGLAQGDERVRKEASARAKVTEAGLARLDELAEAGSVDEDTANVYRQLFEMRLDREGDARAQLKLLIGDDGKGRGRLTRRRLAAGRRSPRRGLVPPAG